MHLDSYTCELCILQKKGDSGASFLKMQLFKSLLGLYWDSGGYLQATPSDS